MKKVVKIKESQLNEIIKKVIKEQEGQVLNMGPSPEQITGTPDNDTEDLSTEGPNFGQFIQCATELIDQGVTIGNLIDQLLEAQESEPDGEVTPGPETDVEGATETPMA